MKWFLRFIILSVISVLFCSCVTESETESLRRLPTTIIVTYSPGSYQEKVVIRENAIQVGTFRMIQQTEIERSSWEGSLSDPELSNLKALAFSPDIPAGDKQFMSYQVESKATWLISIMEGETVRSAIFVMGHCPAPVLNLLKEINDLLPERLKINLPKLMK